MNLRDLFKAQKREDFEVSIPIIKADEEQQIIYGWASVSTIEGQPYIDFQGDYIPVDELQKAAHDFMALRSAGESHSKMDVGQIVESIVFTDDLIKSLGIELDREGWFVGMKISDADTWAKVRSGDLTEFSIAGRGVRDEIVEKHTPGGKGHDQKAHGRRSSGGDKSTYRWNAKMRQGITNVAIANMVVDKYFATDIADRLDATDDLYPSETESEVFDAFDEQWDKFDRTRAEAAIKMALKEIEERVMDYYSDSLNFGPDDGWKPIKSFKIKAPTRQQIDAILSGHTKTPKFWKGDNDDLLDFPRWLNLSEGDTEIFKTVEGIPGGSFSACVAHFEAKGGVDNPEALCASLEHKATGHWPGERVKKHARHDQKTHGRRGAKKDEGMSEGDRAAMQDYMYGFYAKLKDRASQRYCEARVTQLIEAKPRPAGMSQKFKISRGRARNLEYVIAKVWVSGKAKYGI